MPEYSNKYPTWASVVAGACWAKKKGHDVFQAFIDSERALDTLWWRLRFAKFGEDACFAPKDY